MPYILNHDDNAIPLIPLREGTFETFLEDCDAVTRQWLTATGFTAKPGSSQAIPDAEGNLARVFFGQATEGWLWQLATLPGTLPPGDYRLEADWTADQQAQASLGWGLACYRFDRYRDVEQPKARLLLSKEGSEEVLALHSAQCLVRDLVNTPTEDMGPGQLTDALVKVADQFGARTEVVSGDDLLTENYPAIHAVGRAASRPPRLSTLEWGEPDHPLLVLVGKGVCFDTGGLDLKPSQGMALMKKDMGGAAHVIGLAKLVMQAKLPVRLLVFVPAVENAIAGNAYRPGDIIPTRKGLSVEIGNTDAEGRLVLCDALAAAMELNPDLVLDFATLTGAARVALGPDLPPIFSNQDAVANGIIAAGNACEDPLWQLPLYAPYRKMIDTPVADINNAGKGGFAGAITAALFLQAFIDPDVSWAHVDTFAWSPTDRPGRPLGGEALGLRATFRFLRERYPVTA